MKLNNKGFAISSIMYIILIMAVILISVTLAILSSRKLILNKIKKETADNIYGISYNSVINTLKHEAINYASSNNIEKENIKIGDFETSVSQELLEHHELSDKYLTLSKTNYSYDVYLGQTKKVTDISKPISNMLGIVDYKIEGNSYQQTYTGKNLFNKDAITNSNYSISGEMITLKVIAQNSSTGTSVSLRELCPKLGAGKTYTISYTTDSKGYISIGSYNATGQWKSGASRTITEEDLDEVVRMGGGDTSQERNITFSNIQIEEGTTATSYEPYVGGVASPNPQYPQEIKSVGDKTINLAQKLTNINSSGSTVTNTVLKEETTKEVNASLVKVKPGQTYSLSKTVAGNDFRYFWFDTNPVLGETQSIGGQYLLNTQTTVNITAPENAKYLFVRWSEKYDAGNVQIKENDTSTEYEPYGYKIPVRVRSKNLFDISDIEVNSTTKKIDCNLTEKFVVSAQEIPTSITDANGVDRNIWRMSFTYLDGSMKYMMDDAFKGVAGATNLFTASEENPVVSIEYRSIYIREGAYRNIQIEYGTKATSYEPYIEPVTTNIYLTEPLRKVGDYEDYVSFENGNIVRNIYEHIFNGSENFIISDSVNSYGVYNYRLNIKTPKLNKNGWLNCLSNYFKEEQAFFADAKEEGVALYSDPSVAQLYFRLRNIITLDDFKTWISGLEDKLKSYYPLNESIEEPTTLLQIQNNIGSSMIEIDTSIKPSSVEFTVIEKIRKL